MIKNVENYGPEDFMKIAIKVSKNSKQDSDHPEKPDPYVGVVVVTEDNNEYDTACRAIGMDGHHAEYSLLFDRYADKDLQGASLYVTLEPCSPFGRTELSCSQVIWKKGIKKVYIGMLDPNVQIYSKGVTDLLENNVAVEMFTPELRKKVEKINKKFKNEIIGSIPMYKKIHSKLEDDGFNFEAIDKYIEESGLENRTFFIDRFYKSGDIKLDGKIISYSKEFEITFMDNVGHKYLSSSIVFIDERSEKEINPMYFNGPFIFVLDKLNDFIQNTSVDLHVPYGIVKEAFVNAVVHKDYSSCVPTYVRIQDANIEISNPINISQKKIDEICSFNTSVEPINSTICNIALTMRFVDIQGKGLKTLGAHYPRPKFRAMSKTLIVSIKN